MAKQKRFVSIASAALIVVGAAIGIGAVWQMTGAENLTASQQQGTAEAEPLVMPVHDGPVTDLEVGTVFAKFYAPRFGKNYVRQIAEGTSLSKVLNTVGIGHYLGTAMPGEIGNFAIAGHRNGNGGPMRDIDKFLPGDLVYVETATTKFTYRYLESKIVSPEELGVIAPEPAGLTKKSGPGKYLTLTTCTPIYVNTDRFIAWFEQISEQPL